MIEIRLASDQDHHSWDSYVNEHPDASPYHLQAWVRSIEEVYGHNGFSLIAYEGGQVVGILPVVLMRLPLLISIKLCSLPFCDVGGCLYDTHEIKTALMEAAFDLAQKARATTIEIRESSNNNQNSARQYDGEMGKKYRMMMSLPHTSDELWKTFKSKLRSQVKKSEKNGLTYIIGRTDEHLEGFYDVFSQNMRNLGSPVHSKKWFKSIKKHYAQDMLISLVKLDDKVVGAGLVLLVNRTATIPWASTIPEYNKYAPNMLLYWSLLKHVTDNGCKRFDFGRSTYNEGTYKFKQQWGAQPIPLDWSSYTPSGAVLDVRSKNSKLRPIVERIWRNLPLVITNTVGPLVRKHISL